MREKSFRLSDIVIAIAGMVIGWAIVTDMGQYLPGALGIALILITVALLCREVEKTLAK